jgi:hypothetical protein
MSVCCVLNGVCRATMTNATSISKFGVLCNVLYAQYVLTSFVPHKEEEEEEEDNNNKLQKKSHIGHCPHYSGRTNIKVQNIFHGRNSITCSENCEYRTAATLYPRNMVCFRYIIVNTPLKGDNKDDDDDDDNNNNNKFVELTICRMGMHSLHLEFCSEFRVDIRGNVTIFCFKISLERPY